MKHKELIIPVSSEIYHEFIRGFSFGLSESEMSDKATNYIISMVDINSLGNINVIKAYFDNTEKCKRLKNDCVAVVIQYNER